MRFALDASPLTMSSGGLRRYAESLAQALKTSFPEDEFELLMPHGRLWWSVQLPLAMRHFDMFHGTNFEVPYLPVRPAVMTVHDTSPWANPEWHSGAGRVQRRSPALIGLGLATMLIVPTRAVAREVTALFQVPPSRIRVVPEGSSLQPVASTAPSPFFLFVGTVEPRKNVPQLVDAWRPLKDRVGLVIVGRRREDGPLLVEEEGLQIRGEVTDSELAELLSSATALVYPSEYEGFGLPVVEAMRCGAPVITSRAAALLEVSDGAALHVDLPELRQAMAAVFDSAELRGGLRQAGLRRAAEFTWERAARLTREVYAEAIERHRSFA